MTDRHPALDPSRWGLRIRGALIVAVTSTAAVALSGFALAETLDQSLIRSSDNAAITRVHEVATQLDQRNPDQLDPGLLATGPSLVAVQVLDASGRVVHTSYDGPGYAMTDDIPGSGVTLRDARPSGHDQGRRLIAETVSTSRGTFTIVAATNQDSIEDTIRLVAVLTAIGGLFIVAIAAIGTYLLIGRSLRSVDDIRRRVAVITTEDLAEHVPVPKPRDEIAHLAATMNDMLDRINASHTSQQRFISDASHELRSPLTTITTSLEIGAHRPELMSADLIGTVLLPEAVRMGQLVDDLLLLARADEHGLTLRSALVDLDHIVENEAVKARSSTSKTVSTRLEPVQVRADAPKLSRAIRNVIDNAVRFAASRISVELAVVDSSAVVIVTDDGPGIPLELRGRVFDRFYRVDDERARSAGGSGLGLPITAEIIAAHHGTITIDKPAGSSGTEITLRLPIV